MIDKMIIKWYNNAQKEICGNKILLFSHIWLRKGGGYYEGIQILVYGLL